MRSEGVQGVWPSALESLFQRSVVVSPDGTRLNVYTCGQRANPPLLLVNAYGLPVELWEPFARAMSIDHYVLTWESRDVPTLDQPFAADRCGVGYHAEDLLSILDNQSIDRATVVGWCSGAQVALRVASQSPSRVTALVLLSGNFRSFPGVPVSDFQQTMGLVWRNAAANRRMAEAYWRMLFATAPAGAAPTSPPTQKSNAFAAAWAEIPSSIRSLTAAPYRSAETLYRYAATQMAVEGEPGHAWTSGIRAPVLVLGGDQDVVVNPLAWCEVARRLPRARLIVRPGGDHYMHHQDRTLPDLIRSFSSDPERFLQPGAAEASEAP